jgi:hypothetical protein
MVLAGGSNRSHDLDVLRQYIIYGDCFSSFVASDSGGCLRASPEVALSCAAIRALNRESGLLTRCAYVPDSVICPSIVMSVTVH